MGGGHPAGCAELRLWVSPAPPRSTRLGIAPATRLAAQRAVSQLSPQPQHLLIDYIRLPEIELPQTSLPKGDARSLSIACASMLAKVERDALLRQLDGDYPVYGFAQHKGYGTAVHRAAIDTYGACAIHRHSFAPLPGGRRTRNMKNTMFVSLGLNCLLWLLSACTSMPAAPLASPTSSPPTQPPPPTATQKPAGEATLLYQQPERVVYSYAYDPQDLEAAHLCLWQPGKATLHLDQTSQEVRWFTNAVISPELDLVVYTRYLRQSDLVEIWVGRPGRR